MTSTAPTTTAPRLLARDNAPLVVGAIALVTLGATENRAVSTVLPTMLGELDAIGGFGLVMAAPLATYLISLAVSGWWCDRSGPVPTLRIGAALFLGAQVLVGTATSLVAVVGGRLLSGLAEGMLDISLMVLVARALDPALRPRMMALFAAAWVLPSVAGPVITGLVTETVGWRWVFLGALILLAPTWLLLRPAMATPDLGRRAETPPTTGRAGLGRILPWAVVGAAGLVVLNVAAEGGMPSALVAGLVVGGGLAVAAAARVLLPPGSLRATCGIGGIVALRGLLSAAFAGIGGFLPLILSTLHHQPPTVAGVSLSVTGVMWSLGSAIQSRLSERPGLLLHLGFGALALGLAGASLLVWTSLPLAVGLAGWGIAGLGIGLTSSTLSVLTMTVSDDTNQGQHNAGGQMASSMAIALFYAGAGAVLAVLGTTGRLGFEVVTTAAVMLALLGLVGVRRALCAVGPAA